MQRSLDGFTLIELIGFGGWGEVWRAQTDADGSQVALKWLTDQTVDIELLGARLRDFEHPHVARLLDVGWDGANVVLVEQFVPGISLAALLAERDRLSGAEVITLLTPIADALGVAHAAGILHGNLTPTAVRFTSDGRPILTELGLRQSLARPTAGPAQLEYLDPQVARGGVLTEASDVFGVAAIGFHALTGRPPWTASSGPTSWELAVDVAVDLAPLHAGSAAGLAAVIARGLSSNPALRGSARQFAEDVRNSLEPEPLHLSGTYVWPDLPAAPDLEGALDVGGKSQRSGLDIAGEVRRGGSARHAATAGSRHEAAPQLTRLSLHLSPPSRLRAAARLISRRAVLGAFVVLAMLGMVVLGLGWNASEAVPAQAGRPIGGVAAQGAAEALPTEPGMVGADDLDERVAPKSAGEWLALLNALYERRAAAFQTGAVALLDQVFTPASPQLALDRSEVMRLVAAGQLLRGFAPQVVDVHAFSMNGDQASLEVTDTFADYQIVPASDSTAAPLGAHPGRGPAAVTMTMLLTDKGWRIHTARRRP